MSAETPEWLLEYTRTGFVAQRGLPWHGTAGAPNVFDGPVPWDEAERFFADEVEASPLYVVGRDGGYVEIPGRIATRYAGSDHVMGIHSDSYGIHQYKATLLETTAAIAGDGLAIGSLGMLRQRAQAWVSMELPDNVTTPEGETYRPSLLAASSHDGSLASVWKLVITRVVCDNTLSMALAERGRQVRVKHSRNSMVRVRDVRQALELIHDASDKYAATVKALCEIDVSDRAWSMFLDAHAPIAEPSGEPITGRSLTMRVNMRESLTRLWNTDTRVSPWRGTAWGVVQAVNTYTHHEQTVRNMSRGERNWSRTLSGDIDGLDTTTMATLTGVLAAIA